MLERWWSLCLLSSKSLTACLSLGAVCDVATCLLLLSVVDGLEVATKDVEERVMARGPRTSVSEILSGGSPIFDESPSPSPETSGFMAVHDTRRTMQTAPTSSLPLGLHKPRIARQFLLRADVNEVLLPLEKEFNFRVRASVHTRKVDERLVVLDLFIVFADDPRSYGVQRTVAGLQSGGITTIVVPLVFLPETSAAGMSGGGAVQQAQSAEVEEAAEADEEAAEADEGDQAQAPGSGDSQDGDRNNAPATAPAAPAPAIAAWPNHYVQISGTESDASAWQAAHSLCVALPSQEPSRATSVETTKLDVTTSADLSGGDLLGVIRCSRLSDMRTALDGPVFSNYSAEPAEGVHSSSDFDKKAVERLWSASAGVTGSLATFFTSLFTFSKKVTLEHGARTWLEDSLPPSRRLRHAYATTTVLAPEATPMDRPTYAHSRTFSADFHGLQWDLIKTVPATLWLTSIAMFWCADQGAERGAERGYGALIAHASSFTRIMFPFEGDLNDLSLVSHQDPGPSSRVARCLPSEVDFGTYTGDVKVGFTAIVARVPSPGKMVLKALKRNFSALLRLRKVKSTQRAFEILAAMAGAMNVEARENVEGASS